MLANARSARPILLLVMALVLATSAVAAPATTDRAELARIADRAQRAEAALQGDRYRELLGAVVGPMATLLADPDLQLVGVLPGGRPLFYATDNLAAAVTVSTDRVWPGGSLGLNLTGVNNVGSLAIWDGGVVRASHQEFQGRVTLGNPSSPQNNHATHVAGTMVAAGIDPEARGMSPAATLVSYFWNNDTNEMAAAAASGLHLSNHSYGFVAGWRYGWNNSNDWYWFGDVAVSEVEDAGFGFYNTKAAEWDAVMQAAPFYLIVKSAGNDRNDAGPGPGGGHFAWSYDVDDWAWSTATRDPDGGLDGFDSIPYHGVAKNILSVGAVDDIAGGWSAPADVVMSAFSGWGPTDDGRIKPDLVANGIGLRSSLASGDADYANYSGTSMAAPNVTGSLNLLVRQYQALFGGQAPLASTVKAIVLHTASEAGPAPGPDYVHGWGLLNTAAAAQLIADHGAGGRRIVEATLANQATDTYRFYHDGAGELKVTLVWTDPAATPPAWSLNPTTPMLFHDLDVRLVREDDGAVLRPWILDPANPSAPATTGRNFRDNVEVVEATGAGVGAYRVEVSHMGSLQGSQVYSLVTSGLQPISVTAAEAPTARPQLLAAAPNPFNPRTEIAFSLDRAEEVELAVFDMRGRQVTTLLSARLEGGRHRVAWNGDDSAGRPASAGVYLVRLRAGATVDQLRVSLVK